MLVSGCFQFYQDSPQGKGPNAPGLCQQPLLIIWPAKCTCPALHSLRTLLNAVCSDAFTYVKRKHMPYVFLRNSNERNQYIQVKCYYFVIISTLALTGNKLTFQAGLRELSSKPTVVLENFRHQAGWPGDSRLGEQNTGRDCSFDSDVL